MTDDRQQEAVDHGVRVVAHPDPDSLAVDVATRLVGELARVQDQGRVPAVGLTGGSIADRIHRAVAAAESSAGEPAAVDWSRVDFWFGDERYVPADDPDRNALQARRAMLDHLPVDPSRVHEMPAADGPHADVHAAAAAYADEVRAHGSGELDVMVLGMGPDGHVASLFPGRPEVEVDDTVALGVTESPKPPPQRISLTLPALNRAREVWFVVAGAEKAESAARALDGDASLPAARVHGHVRTVWFVDRDAASALSGPGPGLARR